jgi:pimeloyl-ACP methyl ester carboxylesterase
MPVLASGGVDLHVEDEGDGPAVIALHGFGEAASYWSAAPAGEPSVKAALSASFRFVAMDMRGHARSRTRSGASIRMTADAVAADVFAVADHLGIERFHMLAHATGCVAALRVAFQAPERVAGMILTNGASACAMMGDTHEENTRFFGRMSAFYARMAADGGWDAAIKVFKAKPWPFLHQLDRAANATELWNLIEAVFRLSDLGALAAFARDFYIDPDPRVAAMQALRIPTLVVASEHDELMSGPSRLIHQSIPDCEFADLPGVGHMTALECPATLTALCLDFLHRRTA